MDTHKTESVQERRTLAAKPKKIFSESQQLENYISDHLLFRDEILSLYFRLGFGFNFGTKKILIGKKDWLFMKVHDTRRNLPILESYQNKVVLSEEQHQKMIDNLVKMKKFCDENHIRLYLLFPPSKDRIYFRYMPSYILRDKRLSPVKQFVSKLPSDLTVVPLEDFLIQKSYTSKEPLYYKQDTHWSEEGAFWVYHQLIENMQKDFPNLKPKMKDDFVIQKTNRIFMPYNNLKKSGYWGNGALFLPGLKNYNSLEYNHYTYNDLENIKIIKNTVFISSTYPKGFPLKIYIIGDSFATFLHPYLSATFQYVHSHRFNPVGEGHWGIHFYERMKEMLEDGTDVLILSISDLKLKDLLEPFK